LLTREYNPEKHDRIIQIAPAAPWMPLSNKNLSACGWPNAIKALIDRVSASDGCAGSPENATLFCVSELFATNTPLPSLRLLAGLGEFVY